MDARVIEGYRLTRRLDYGQGDLFEGVREAEPRRVAIELVVEAQRSAEAYWHDARVAAGCNHPAIVAILGCGRLPGRECYTIFEAVEGPTLEALIARGPVPPGRLRSVLEPIYGAVSAAHGRAIVHGGIYPGAVLVGEHQVKLLDFGRSKLVAMEGALHRMPYIAPEQLGGSTDERSDVFGLAATVWATVVGRPPRSTTSIASAAADVLNVPIGSARAARREVPPALDAAILHGLARDPNARPSSVAAAWRELSAALP